MRGINLVKICLVLGLWPFCNFAGEVTATRATSVTAAQRYPWNGLVDVTVTMRGASNDIIQASCYFTATNIATQKVIPVDHITRNGTDTGSGMTWTRKFIWDATADVGEVQIEDVIFVVEASLGVQLWENGPYWAECNVGATKPEEARYYFWWGDTVGYTYDGRQWNAVDGSRKGFEFNDSNCPTYNEDKLQSEGYIDASGNLVAKYDAATKHWGAPWRMPTNAEFWALINNCDMVWTTRNGVAGRLVKGRGAYASKSIFLPAAGRGYGSYLGNVDSYGIYWSSTRYSDNSYDSWHIYFYSSNFYRNYYLGYRYYGQSVRPLRGFAQ